MRKLALRTIVLVLFSAGLLPLASSLAHAQDETKVGVTVSAVINAESSVGIKVSAALGKALGETLNVTVLAGADAQARLPEAARSETCLGESSCLVSAGKALEVDQLLMLIIVGVGDELKVEATWVDVASGETALRPGITTGETPSAMRAAFTANAQELLPGVAERTTNTTTSPTITTPLDTTVTPGTEPVRDPKPKGDEGNGTAKVLMYGGGALLGVGAGYFFYQLAATCDGSLDCPEDNYSKGRDVAFDVVGVVGAVALSAGLFMHLTADDKEAAPGPVGLNIGSDSFRVSYGGNF
tara:strand:+ start:126995 stop:127888 length:894 start_codon:yes stop_codon:yes gene_type:complete